MQQQHLLSHIILSADVVLSTFAPSLPTHAAQASSSVSSESMSLQSINILVNKVLRRQQLLLKSSVDEAMNLPNYY